MKLTRSPLHALTIGIRVGGMAELAGFDLSLNPRRRETLRDGIESSLFPNGGDVTKSLFWTGLRPDDARWYADYRQSFCKF